MTPVGSDAILALPEAEAIQEARDLLASLVDRLHLQAYAPPSEVDAWTARRAAINMGRLIEATTRAEYALFTLLNVASSYCHSPEAEAMLDRDEVKP